MTSLRTGRQIAISVFGLHDKDEIKKKITSLRLLANRKKDPIPHKRIGSHYYYYLDYFSQPDNVMEPERPALWLR